MCSVCFFFVPVFVPVFVLLAPLIPLSGPVLVPFWSRSALVSHHSHPFQVICEKNEKSDIAEIDKKKYLVPQDLTVSQFVYVIRKRIKLAAEKSIFIFINNVIPPSTALMSAIYEEHKDEDGFLYITYSGENTFGGIEW